jgi:branched-chain amino acid transport system substrate-binding protein
MFLERSSQLKLKKEVRRIQMKRWLIKVIAAVSCLVFSAAMPFGAKAAEVFKIGALYPLSGPMALLGTHDMNGVELATDMFNERGGVKGKKVMLVKCDAPTPEAARSEAERMVSVEKLDFLFGTYSSSLSFVAASVAEKHKKIFWETGAIADNITQRKFKYLFRTCTNSSAFGYAAADFITKKLAKDFKINLKDLKVAIAHEDSLYGTSVMSAAGKRLKESGVNVVAFESYSKSVTDLSPLVMKFKMLKPDIILTTCYTNDAILWQRQMREMNLNIKAMVGTGGGHGILDFAKATGKDSDGVFSADFPLVKNPKSLSPKLDPPLNTVRERYKKKYGDYPDLHAMSAFTGAWVFYANVLAKTNSLNPDAVRAAALKLDIPVGGTHMGWGVKFPSENSPEAGQNERAFSVMMQWQGGLNYCVWPDAYAERKAILVPLPNWKDR